MKDHPEDCACCCDGYATFLGKTEENIRQYGVSIIGTETHTPNGNLAMAYTIGMSDVGKPEIVTFGLPSAAAMAILNDAAKRLREDKLPLDTLVEELGNLPLVFKNVPASIAACYVIQANNRAGRELPAIQMVWPDPQGRFPWEHGFDQRFSKMQPSLYQFN